MDITLDFDTEYRSTMSIIDEDFIDLPDVIEWPDTMQSMEQIINEVRRWARDARADVTVEVYNQNTVSAGALTA